MSLALRVVVVAQAVVLSRSCQAVVADYTQIHQAGSRSKRGLRPLRLNAFETLGGAAAGRLIWRHFHWPPRRMTSRRVGGKKYAPTVHERIPELFKCREHFTSRPWPSLRAQYGAAELLLHEMDGT